MGFIFPGTLSGRSGGFLNPAISSEGPGLVSNLEFWFRADTECFTDLAGTIQAADGEFVRAIGDKSGNFGSVITVENDTRRPIYRDSGINSVPTLDYDGTDDRFLLAGASATVFELERTTAFSFFHVFNSSVSPGFFEKDGLGIGWEYYSTSQDVVFNIYNTNGVDGIRVVTTSNKIVNSTDIALIITKDTTAAASGFNIYINSTTGETVSNTLDNALSTTVSASNLILPERSSARINGDGPEWSFHKKEFTAGDISTLMTYAGDRYGITIT
jgi:hypothetical protein